MEIITSKTNKYVKLCHSLCDKKYRKESGLCLLEGKKIITEAIKCNKKVDFIFTTINNYEVAVKEFEKINIFVADKSIIEYMSSTLTPQDYVGVCHVDTDRYFLPDSNYLLLDSLQDPSNLGMIIRTAVATGFTNIYLLNCVDEYSTKVVRSSMGNLFRCKFVHITYNEIKDFKDTLYICDMCGENIFTIHTFDKIVGLCIGNEGHGISSIVKEIITKKISLPMKNDVESLNAGVSASVIMYHISINQKEIS